VGHISEDGITSPASLKIHVVTAPTNLLDGLQKVKTQKKQKLVGKSLTAVITRQK